MDANLAVLERLTAQLRLNSDNQNRALERREALARQLTGSEATAPGVGIVGVEAPDPWAVKLARLHQELAELRTRFSDKYPDVVRLKAEIAALEAQERSVAAPSTTDKREMVANPFALKLRQAIADTEAEIAALRAEERRLREDFATYQRRVENIPLREQEFQELSRDYDTTSELYRTLLKRYEEAQLAETLEQRQKGEQFRIVEAAIPPSAPSAPNRGRLLLIGAALSGALAVAVALLAEKLDGSFHDIDELRRVVGVPVMARIPRIVTQGDAERGRRRMLALACMTMVVVALTMTVTYATARGRVPVVSGLVHSLLLRT
jgi:polysaccharide chain length determinant protein (PEP-CTERM system associated)